jgi:hypothetical protein
MASREYVHPGTHAGTQKKKKKKSLFLSSPSSLFLMFEIGGPTSTDPNAIIYGTRLRLKSTFDSSSLSEQPVAAATLVLIKALQTYGMFLADGVCDREDRRERSERAGKGESKQSSWPSRRFKLMEYPR